MSSNVKYVVGLAGPRATELSELLLDLTKRYSEGAGAADMQPDDLSAEPTADAKRVVNAVAELKDGMRHLPVVFFRTWLDGWSVASSDVHVVLRPIAETRMIYAPSHTLGFLLERDFEVIRAERGKVRRRSFYRNQQEDRWTHDAFWDAMEAINSVPLPKLVVYFNEGLGGSRSASYLLDACGGDKS